MFMEVRKLTLHGASNPTVSGISHTHTSLTQLCICMHIGQTQHIVMHIQNLQNMFIDSWHRTIAQWTKHSTLQKYLWGSKEQSASCYLVANPLMSISEYTTQYIQKVSKLSLSIVIEVFLGYLLPVIRPPQSASTLLGQQPLLLPPIISTPPLLFFSPLYVSR